MSDQPLGRSRRSDAALALIAVGAVLVVLLALRFADLVLTTVQFAIGGGLEYLPGMWSGTVGAALAGPVPFGIGLVLAFWLVAPSIESSSLGRRIGTAVIAGLVAAAIQFLLVLVVGFLLAVVRAGWTGDLVAHLEQLRERRSRRPVGATAEALDEA